MASSRNNTLEFSSGGSEVLATGNLSSTLPSIGAIQVINDAVISVLTTGNVKNSASLVGPTIPAGTIIYGQFTAVTISSGVAICHRV